MATKTITIDLEAYEALRSRKEGGESFSDVIKKHFDRGVSGRQLKQLLDRAKMGNDALDALDQLIEERQSHAARAAEL